MKLKGDNTKKTKKIWRKISFVEIQEGTAVSLHIAQTPGCGSGDTGRGPLWPGWTLTFPAQHLNPQTKAVRIGKASTAPFIFNYFSILKSLLGKETNKILARSPVWLCCPVNS